MEKVVTKKEFKEVIRPKLKKENKTIALCHGVFDLIHPGHIIHFEQAAEMADILVVSITAAKYVRKGPGRPYFSDDMRLKFLSAIECIDYVMLSEEYTVDDIVEAVEPDFYVKGEEYANEDADVTANMKPERELVEKHGGQVRYTTGRVYSSTKLINRGLAGLPKDVVAYMEKVTKNYSMKDVTDFADKAKKLKVLVIGETIIDRYTYCTVQGLMSKNMAYSARLLDSEDYLGGAAAVARHLATWCKKVTFLSVVGCEKELKGTLESAQDAGVKCCYVESKTFPTIIKQKYLSHEQKREEYTKVFGISNIPNNPKVDDEALGELKEILKDKIKKADVVYLCDFGHGLFDRELIDFIQKEAKFLALNCQTNSSNYGMNIITKYERADAFTLDQKELRLALPALADEEDAAFKELSGFLKSRCSWLTRGSKGAWGLEEYEKEDCPAFTLAVRDTIGAGDAFFSIACLFAAVGAPITVSTIMGNVAGALGANIVGNKKSIERADALKFASTLMNV